MEEEEESESELMAEPLRCGSFVKSLLVGRGRAIGDLRVRVGLRQGLGGAARPLGGFPWHRRGGDLQVLPSELINASNPPRAAAVSLRLWGGTFRFHSTSSSPFGGSGQTWARAWELWVDEHGLGEGWRSEVVPRPGREGRDEEHA